MFGYAWSEVSVIYNHVSDVVADCDFGGPGSDAIGEVYCSVFKPCDSSTCSVCFCFSKQVTCSTVNIRCCRDNVFPL